MFYYDSSDIDSYQADLDDAIIGQFLKAVMEDAVEGLVVVVVVVVVGGGGGEDGVGVERKRYV